MLELLKTRPYKRLNEFFTTVFLPIINPRGSTKYGTPPAHALRGLGADKAKMGKLIRSHLDRANINGVTPLHIASRGTKSDFVKILLEDGCNIETRNLAGFKPKDLVQDNDVKNEYNSRYLLVAERNDPGTSRYLKDF